MRRHSSRGWVVGLLVLVGVGFLTAMPAHAQTTIYTWLTSPSDWDWDASSLDWTTGGPNTSWSSSTTASQAVFNSPGQTVTVSSGILADAITIDSGATGYIFNSGGITLGSGGITDYASATLNTPVTLGANNQTWTIAPSQTLTIGGVISDGGNNYGLTLTGGGSVSLTAGNTYTGGTTVAGGTLTLSGGSGAIASTAIVVGPGATFYLNNNTGADSTSRTAATVPVTLNGGTFSYLGHLTLSGTETEHFGPLTLGPGQSTVTVSGGGSSGTDHAQIVFGSSTALGSDLLYTAMSGAMVNFTSTIQGQGGPGGAYYSSAAGQTAGPSDNIMFGGPVTNGASSIYGPAAWIVVNGYDFARFSGSNGIHEQDAGTNGTPVATIVNSINTAQAGGYIILTSNTNANCTASETINTLTVHSGTAITSTLTNCKITIANTSVGGGTALDSNGGICVSGSAPFTPSGGYTLTGGTITAGVANSNAELLVWIDSNTTTINSAIQDNGSGKILLSKNGSGTLALTGANTYSYGTDINAGVLNFASGSLPLNNITFYGGTLQWAANNTQDVSAGIAAIPSGQAAMIDTNGNAVSFGTGLSGSGGLVKLGANTLTLAATSTYTGGTTVSVGTLQLGNGTSANGAVQGTITDNSVLAVAPYQPQTVANAMTGSGVLTVAGPAAVSLTNTANSYSGGTSVTGGSLVLGATSGNVTGSGAISVSGGSLNVTNTASVNSNLSVGSGGVLGGSGTLVLPSGKSLALAGTLAPSFGLAGTNTLTVSGGSVTLNAGATLNYNFGAPGGNDLFQVAGGTLSLLSGANDTINVNSISGSGSYVVLAATGGGTLSDSLHYTNWNVNGNSNYNYYVLNPGDSAVQTSAGPQSGTANEVILYVTPGSPTSVWAGANGPGGNVWSATAGTALAPAGNWGGNAYSDGNNKVVFGDSGGTAGNNTVNITGSVSPISVTFGNSPAVSYTLAGGPITGATTTLSVTGGGSVTLSQTNTYGGTTLVSSGMLGIGPTGSIASAVVTVGAAGTLSVSGSWSGSTSLSDGGVVNVVSGGSISVPAISVAAGGALNVSGSLSGLSGSTALTVNGSATFGNSSQALPGLAGTGTVTLASGTNLTPASLAGFTGTVTGGGGMLFNSGATVAVPATATLNYTGGTTVSNGGTLQVSGNNKLGSVTVNSSTLEALGGFAFATSAAITMSGTNPTLLVDSGGTVTLDTAMPAGAAWIKGGAGTLAFSGAATMPSGVSFTATGGGVVDLGGNEHWPSQVIVGGSGGSTIQNGWLNASGGYYLNGNATISAYLIGSANLLASGGANVLSGVNTYSGSTTVSGGTLTLTGASGAIPNTSGIIVGPGATFYVKDATGGTSINTSRTSTTVPVTLNGGKFSYLGNTSYTGTEPEQFGVLTLGPGQSTVTVSGGGSGGTDHADIYFGSTTGATGLSSDLVYTPMSGAMVNFTSTIQGQGGPGGAYYSGAAGQTAGPADFIMFGGPATAGASSIYGPAAWIVVNGHDFARFSGSNGIHEQDAGTNGNPVATVANNITEAQGTGYVILTSGANASCGANETINTLTVQSASPITSTLTNCEITIANTSVGGGTALDSNGGICVSGSAPFTASGGYTLTGGTITAGSGANAELLVWIDSNTTTINSVIADNGAGKVLLSKNGSGTLALTGANTYSYGTDINAGVLNFAAGSLPVNNIAFYGGTLQWAAGNTQDVSAGIAPIPSGQAAMIDTNNNPVTFGSGLSGSGGLVKLGTGTLTLAASNTYAGGTTISTGSLQLGDGATRNGYVQGNILNQSALVFANPLSQTYAGAISGNGSVTVTGPNTLVLTGNSTYNGGTSVAGGTLVLGSAGGTPAGSGAVAVLSGGALAVTNTANLQQNVTVQSGATLGGSGTLALSSSNYSVTVSGTLAPSLVLGGTGTNALTVNGSVNLNAGAILNYNFGSANASDLLAVTGNNNVLTLNSGTDTLNLNGAQPGNYLILAASNGASLVDNATLTLSGTNWADNYTVSVASNQVVLHVAAGGIARTWTGQTSNVWSTAPGDTNWTGTGNAFGNKDAVTFADVAANRQDITIDAGGVLPGSVTFDNKTTAYTFSGGPIGGPGTTLTLSSSCSGTVTLYQTNSYTGNTTVSSGTLNIGPAGSIVSPTVTVAGPGTLNVSGSWSGSGLLADSGLVNVVSGGSISVATISVAAGGVLNVTGSLSALSGNPALAVNGSATFSNASQTLASLGGLGLVTLNGTQLTLPALALTGTLTGSGGLNYAIPSGATNAAPVATLSYTGGTTIGTQPPPSGPTVLGTFQANSDSNFGSTGGIWLNNATLEVTGSFTTARAITVGSSTSTILVDSGGTLTVNAPMAATAAPGAGVTFSGGGVVDLGNQTHSPGVVTLGGGTTIQDGILNASKYVFNGNGTISAALQGGGLLASAGTSTLSSLSNTYTGGTTVQSGAKLVLSTGAAPGASTSPITLSGGVLSASPALSPSALGSGLLTQFYALPGQTTTENAAAAFGGSLATIATHVATLAYAGSAYTQAAGQTNLDFSNSGYGAGNMFASLGYTGPITYFDAVMSGYINLPTAGTYQFAIKSDDGSVLFIDGKQVINDNGYTGGDTNTNLFPVVATAGVHQITVGYYNGAGNMGLQVWYTPPGGTQTIIPNSVMAPFAAASVPYGNPVTVAASSTLDVEGGLIADFGALAFANTGSTLTTTGMGTVRFTGTTLGGGPGTNGFTVNSTELAPGPLSMSTSGVIAVGGSGFLSLTATSGSLPAGTQFQVATGATLLAVGSNAFQGAGVSLSNSGTLVLAATSATASYDVMLPTSANPLTLAGSTATIVAGVGPLSQATPLAAIAAGAVNNATVTLASTGTLGIAAGQTLALASNNGYTLLQGPSLVLSDSGTISVTAGSVSLVAGNMIYSGGTLTAAGNGTATVTGPVVPANAGIYAPQSTGTIVFSGNYSGAPGNLVPAAGGTIVLNASNSVSGTLYIAGGAFVAGNSASFGSTTLAFSGGTIGANTALTGTSAIANALTWAGGSTVGNSINIFNGAGAQNIEFNQPLSLGTTAGTVYTINDPGTHSTFSGAISGSGGLSITGYPTLSNTNTYSGGTSFNANTSVSIGNNQGFGSGTLYFNGGGFQSTIALTGSTAVANSYAWAAGQTMYLNGTNPIQLTSNATVPSTASVAVNNVAMVGTLSGVLSGGSLTHSSNGAWGGALVISNSGNTFAAFTLATQSGTTDVGGASTVLNSTGGITSGPLGIGPITVGDNNNGAINLANLSATPAVLANPVTLFERANFTALPGSSLTLSGPITITDPNNNGVYGVYPSGNIVLSGTVSGAGKGIVINGSSAAAPATSGVVTNSGVLTLSNTANSFTGTLTVSGGTLVAGGNAPSGAVGVFGNAVSTITLGDGNSAAYGIGLLAGGPYTIGRSITVANDGGGTTIGGNTANSSTFSGAISLAKTPTLVALSGGTANFSNVISGAGGVTVGAAGYTGSVALGGSNAYTGSTAVNYGTLTLTGSGAIASTGAITVASGATLGGGGTGTTTAPVVINAGGTLSPSLAGPLTLANTVTFNDGSNYGLIAGGNSVGLLNVSGVATSGTVNVQITARDLTTLNGGTYTFLNWTTSGPTANGPQSNWNVPATGNATWAGAGTDSSSSSWSTPANWSGVQISGGTVVAANVSGGSGSLQLSGATSLAYSSSAPGGAETSLANVFIQTSAGVTVTGPTGSSTTTIASLTLGSASGGVNTLNLGTSPLSVTGAAGATVNATGNLNVGSGNLSTTGLAVAGTAGVGPSGSLTASSVTLSGAGQFAANGGGSIGSLSLPGGITGAATVGGTTTVSDASVAGGTANFNSSGLIANLSLTGGTANFGAGAMAATADFSAGTGTANAAASPLAVTNTLKLNNGVTAVYTPGGGATSFTAGGSNLVTGQTLTLSGGKLAMSSAISLVDPGTLWSAGSTTGTLPLTNNTMANPFTVSQAANVLVVDLNWRNVNAAPTVTWNGAPMTQGAMYTSNLATYVNSGIYYLWGTNLTKGSGTLSVNFNGAVNEYAVDAFTLSGVDTTTVPNGTLGLSNTAGWEVGGGTSYSGTTQSLPLGTDVAGGAPLPAGAWANFTTAYRQQVIPSPLLTASVTSGSGTLNGTGQAGGGGTAANGNFWDCNTGAYCICAGALVENITTGNLTLQESNTLGALNHWVMAGVAFAPAAAVYSPNTNLVLTSSSSFAAPSGFASTFGTLTFNNADANLTFTGGAANTMASFAGIYAAASAAIVNDTNDLTQLVIPSGGTVGAASGQTLTIGVQIADPTSGGSSGLLAVGPGTVALTNVANSYSGGTTVRGGTLSFVPGSLPQTGTVVSDPVAGGNSTATILWAAGPYGANTTDLSSNGPLTLNSGNTVLNFAGAQGYPVVFDGTVSGSGNLEISGGTLQFGSNSYGSTGNLATAGSVTIDAGAGLTFNRGDNYVVSNNIGGHGSLMHTGEGTLILTGSNTYTGGTTVAGGPLQIGNGGSTGSLAGNVYLPFYYSSLVFNRTGTVAAPGNISGAGGLAQEGSGTLILSGTNTYSGGTSVENGLLVATNPKAISGGSLLDVGSSGSVVLGQQGSQYIEGLGQMAGAPLGSQASGTSGGGVMAPAASGSAGGAGGINSVPEPGTLALLAAAAACGMAAAWRRRKGEQRIKNEG